MTENAADEETRVYPHFTFDIPSDFHELPLAEPPAARTERLRAFADEALGENAAEYREAFAGLLEDLMSRLADRDVVHASFGVTTIEEHPSSASLTVSVQPLDYDDPRVAVDGMAAILAAQDLEGREVGTLELPCGPAVSVTAERGVPIPAEVSPTGENLSLEIGEFQAYVPVPSERSMLVLTLSTPSLPDWEVYAHVMGAIVRSVSFTEPDYAESEEHPT